MKISIVRLVSYPIIRAFTSICVGLAVLCYSPALWAAGAEDTALPGFEDTAGHNVSLHDFIGKALVVNLWASWCAPCAEEMPSLVSLQGEYKGKELVVLALSENDTLADALKFYKDKSITTLTPYFDKGHAVWTSLKARGLPTTILIDRSGRIVKIFEGPVDQSPQFKKDIDRLVSGN